MCENRLTLRLFVIGLPCELKKKYFMRVWCDAEIIKSDNECFVNAKHPDEIKLNLTGLGHFKPSRAGRDNILHKSSLLILILYLCN